MEERIIVKGKIKDSLLALIWLPLIGIAIYLIDGLIVTMLTKDQTYGYYYREKRTMAETLSDAFGKANGINEVLIPLIFVLAVVGVVLYIRWRKVEITVTDKRVYGTSAWGKRVDLPLDLISAVGTSWFNGLAVTTSSGAIKFILLENRNELHDEISKLLVDRQNKPVTATTIRQEMPQSSADELKKYKDLLDSGIITQEEFDAKKKQLLGQ